MAAYGSTGGFGSAANSAAAALVAIAAAGASTAAKVAAAEGALGALVGALGQGGSIAANACTALASIAAVDREHAIQVADEPGAVPALLDALRGRHGEGAADSAAACLCEISRLGPHASSIFDASNAVPALAAALAHGGPRPAGAAAALLAEMAAASPAHAGRIVSSPGGALAALVSAATSRSAAGPGAVPSAALALKHAAVAAAELPLPPALQRYVVAALIAALRAPEREGEPEAGEDTFCLMRGLVTLAGASEECARAVGETPGAARALVRGLRCSVLTCAVMAASVIMKAAILHDDFPGQAAEEAGLLPGLVLVADAGCVESAALGLSALAVIGAKSPALAGRVAAEPGIVCAALGALLRSPDEEVVVGVVRMLFVAIAARVPAATAFALSRLLAPAGGPYAGAARSVLSWREPGLTMSESEVDALEAAALEAEALQERVAALEALHAAAAAELEARPRVCAACGRPASDALKLHPCAGCSGGPAGSLYCGLACQREDWRRHRPYCRCAAAAKAALIDDSAEGAPPKEAAAPAESEAALAPAVSD